MNRSENLTKPLMWLMALLIAAFVAGCSSTVSSDNTAPTVSSTTPVSAATGVPLNTSVTAIFSEALDPSTVTATTFTLKRGVTPVAGAVSYVGTTATFNPDSNFAASTVYTATVTTGVTDLAGNALEATKTWSFTTGTTPDTTAPTVSSTVPANLATGVAVNANFTAIFSEPMDPVTITNVTVTLRQGVTPVAGAVTYVGTTATFNPDSNLADSTVYTATVTTGVTDLAGNALAATKTWSFTTGTAPDTTAPTMSSTVPVNLATGVAVNANFTAIFSEPMDPITITNVTVTLKQGATPVAGAVTYVGTTATFNPDSNLAASTVYTATVTTGVTDLAGNALAVTKTWSFTTGTTPDIIAPTVSSTVPANAATGVAVNANFTAIFSEPMDPITITNVTVTLMQGATPVAGAVTYAGNTATFTPDSDLAASTVHTATVTTGVADLAGNALAVTETWSFTTGAAPGLNLRSAASFAVLAGNITNNAATTTITGDVGAATISSAPTIIGGAFYTTGAPTYDNAMIDLPFVIADANDAGLFPCDTNPSGGMGTVTMTPGVHCIAADADISGVVILTLNGPGVYIFRTAGALTTSAGSSVGFSGGADNTNTTVFWVVGSATVGSPGTFVGTILSAGGITLGDGDTLLNGRVLTTAGTTLTNNTITRP